MAVALHGFSGTGLDWELPVQVFGPRFSAWIAPDLPGHGGSTSLESDRAYSLDGIAQGLDTLIAGLPRPPVLIGYSMGGRAALTYAMRAGDFLAGLVLVGATPGIVDPEERELRRVADGLLAKRIEDQGVGAFADYWETVPLLRSQHSLASPWGDRLRARRRQQMAAELARALRNAGTANMIPDRARLQAIRCPTLWVAGCDDKKFATIAAAEARAMPDAHCVLIKGAGHAPHLEAPIRFRESLEKYLPKV